MARAPSPSPSPRRVEAGRRNHARRLGLSAAGRERLRQAALANRPWDHATGPRTPAGKARSAANGKACQKGSKSVRALRAELADVRDLVVQMRAARRLPG